MIVGNVPGRIVWAIVALPSLVIPSPNSFKRAQGEVPSHVTSVSTGATNVTCGTLFLPRFPLSYFPLPLSPLTLFHLTPHASTSLLALSSHSWLRLLMYRHRADADYYPRLFSMIL